MKRCEYFPDALYGCVLQYQLVSSNLCILQLHLTYILSQVIWTLHVTHIKAVLWFQSVYQSR